MSWPLSPLRHPQTNPTSESNSTLEYHQKSSEQEKCFRCTVCDKRFGQLVNLNRHLQKFHSERGPLSDVFNEAGKGTAVTWYLLRIEFYLYLPAPSVELSFVRSSSRQKCCLVGFLGSSCSSEEMENLFKIELISCVSYMTKG